MHRRIWLAMLAVLVSCAGCDWWRKTPSPDNDSGRAKEVLLDVLETWKQGKVGTLARRTPPIRFVDEDHVEGGALLEYRLASPDQLIGPYDLVPVVIKVKKGGGVVERTTVYQVTLEPKIAVLRAE